MAPQIRVTVNKVFGVPYKVLENSRGCFLTISLGGHSKKTSIISRLAAKDPLEWTNEHHSFPLPADFSLNGISSAEIVIRAFSHHLISYRAKDEFLGSVSISLSGFRARDAAVPKFFDLTGSVNPAVNMKLGVVISFVDFTEQPKQVRPRYDSAPSEPDALNKKIDNRNANNFQKIGSLDDLLRRNPHLERSEMVTNQRQPPSNFTLTLDQTELQFSPRVSSSPAEAAFGAEISTSDDTTMGADSFDDWQQHRNDHGISYGDVSEAAGEENGDFTLQLRPGHF